MSAETVKAETADAEAANAETVDTETIDFHSLSEHFERVHSGRLALRQVALTDSWPLFQATRNPLFNKSLLWDQPGDETLVIDRIDSIVSAARKGKLTALSAVVRTTGEWVSLFRFQPYAANPKFLEIGIWTHDKFWHGRYSLEVMHMCIDAAFEMFQIPTVVGAAALENRSSCRMMELSNMKPSKLVYRQNELGAEVELQEYEISREDWAVAKRRASSYKQIPFKGTKPTQPAPVANSIASAVDSDRSALWTAATDAERAQMASPNILTPLDDHRVAEQAHHSARERKKAVADKDQLSLELAD